MGFKQFFVYFFDRNQIIFTFFQLIMDPNGLLSTSFLEMLVFVCFIYFLCLFSLPFGQIYIPGVWACFQSFWINNKINSI
jgi:hypothetical protein